MTASRSRRGARRAPAEPSPRRWPILVLLPLLVAVGVVVQHRQDVQAPSVAVVSPDGFQPTASSSEATSSTWYCAAGTATGTATGAAEQTVQIANDSDQALSGRLTAFPSAGDSVKKNLDLPAHGRVDVVVSTLVKAPYASALVEVNGGEVAVSHLLVGPTGRTVAACSSSPSESWYVPSGTTRPGTTQQLALFNPFPSEAVVNVTFQADDGTRSPQAYSALVVPGQSLKVLDISATVTLRDHLSTVVTVRSGRVVIDQVQSADGTQGTTKSLTVTPAAPRSSSTWWFPDGPADAGSDAVYHVQNPTDQVAEVELRIRLDDTVSYGAVEPFRVEVQPGEYAAIDVTTDGRVPAGVGYAAVAQSTNGVAIVADRVVSYAPPATNVGATVMMGSPTTASRWIVPSASLTEASAVKVIVTNTSSSDPVTLTVSTLADGRSTPLPGMQNVVVDAGARGGFDVPTGTKQPVVAVSVTGGASVVVEAVVEFTGGGRAAALAVPVSGTNQVATDGIPVAVATAPLSTGPTGTGN